MESTFRRTHWVGVSSVSGVLAGTSESGRQKGGSESGVLNPEREGEGACCSWTQAMGAEGVRVAHELPTLQKSGPHSGAPLLFNTPKEKNHKASHKIQERAFFLLLTRSGNEIPWCIRDGVILILVASEMGQTIYIHNTNNKLFITTTNSRPP